MFKMIGALIIFLSSFLLGYLPLNSIARRSYLLRDFIHDIYYIHNELQSNLISLPELIDLLCLHSGVNTRAHYQMLKHDMECKSIALFSECWKKRLINYRHLLSIEEMNVLSRLGDVLGRYTLEEQLSYINYVISILEGGLRDSKAMYTEKKSLYLGVGSSVGLTLVILLM